MKPRHCYDCSQWDGEDDEGRPALPCHAGHRPRFYRPRDQWDCEYGFKRKCADFMQIEKEET